MRILQISNTDLGGGAEGSAWNLFRAYRERGHESWLAVGRKRSDDPNVFEIPRLQQSAAWGRLGGAMDRWLSPLEKVPGLRRLHGALRFVAGGWPEIERRLGREDFNHPGTRQLLRLLPAPPDIVHAHNLHGGYFDLRFLAPLSHQVPVILNLRDMWLLTGHCAHGLGCERWKIGCGQCPDLGIYPAIKRDATAFNWRRKRRIYQAGRFYVTAISQWLMDRVQESMLHGVQSRLIPNAIDLTVFRPGDQSEARLQLGFPTEARIVTLTAHNRFKDYDVMKSALRQLKNVDGAGLLSICLGKAADACAVGDARMIYPGFERDPRRMALYYRASDVFIHAAKDEAFGKTIAEAMACGTPVVATAVGGIPELLQHEVTGYLVPPGDSVAMAQRVQQLLSDPALGRLMGNRASIVAHQRFDLHRQVDAFLGWYQEILASESGKNALPNPH